MTTHKRFGALFGSLLCGLLPLAASGIGCSGPEQPKIDDPTADLATPPEDKVDLAKPGGADLAVSPGDLAMPTFTCRGGDAPGMIYQLVSDSIKVPSSAGANTFA